jgi:hypothetical protein
MARSSVTQLAAMISRSSVLSRGRAADEPSDTARRLFSRAAQMAGVLKSNLFNLFPRAAAFR